MIYGLIGPNGAGKTTTMRMIMTILNPDRGEITWKGQPVRKVASRYFGYLPEERGLYPNMTIREQLRFFAALHGISGPGVDREIDEWIARLDLTEHATKKVEELSKGNAQKVQFVAALLHHPELLILDEPFSGLDPVNVRLLKEALVSLATQGTTILFSTHRMEHVEELCQRMALIRGGQIVVEGTVDEVRRSTGRMLLRLQVDGGRDGTVELLRSFAELPAPRHTPAGWEVEVPAGFDPQQVLRQAVATGATVTRFEVTPPSLEDVYITIMGGEAGNE
ncbi:MAG: ATP-binding cassette domain-containing protein [Limnochordales bacterium]|nr:ATP-binding cassette domain-containing protein [Limnochordales bacterium]